jgi:hypothetical protein
MSKRLLRKLNSKKYRDTREREITERAASIDELAANARAGRKAGLLRHLNRKMPDWDESDMLAVVALLDEYLPGHGGRKKGSVNKNRRPKDSDAFVAIALAVLDDKQRDPKAKFADLSVPHLQQAQLYDSDGDGQQTVLNWLRRPRIELMKRAQAAGLLPRN